jgi:plasmid stabilization system protein ParE
MIWKASAITSISTTQPLPPPPFKRLYDATKSLKAFPYAGRAGMKSGTRELVLAPLPYLMIYAVDDHSIHILRFLHAAQDRS